MRWRPEPADVAAAVDFAREHHLRLVVKGGAHSYLGTSDAPDSLLIWTRAMNQSRCTMPSSRGCRAAPPPAVTGRRRNVDRSL